MTDAQLLHSVLSDPLFSKLYDARQAKVQSISRQLRQHTTITVAQRRAIQEIRDHLDAWHIGATGLNTEGKFLRKHRAPRRWGRKNRRDPAAKTDDRRRT